MGLKISGLVKFIPNAGGASDANLTISNATYSGTSFSIGNEGNNPTGIFFNPTGTKMFMAGGNSSSVYQYTLGTGYALSTASYDSVSFDVSNEDNNPRSIFFNDVGTKMFMIGAGNDRVHQYTLGTGFDLSSASYDSVSFDVSSQDGGPLGIFFNSTGTKMFMVGTFNNRVHQYTLGTGYDLSTASYDSVSFSVSSQDVSPTGIFFNSVGTKMFMVGNDNNSIYQYTLGTGFDLSTASYDSVSFDVSSQDTGPLSIFFNDGGTKMFMAGTSNDSIYEYNL